MKLSVQITRGIESLFGTRDENIRVLENGLKVSTSLMNDSLEIEGEEPNVIRAASILEDYFALVKEGQSFHNGDLNSYLRVVTADPEVTLRSLVHSGRQRNFGKKVLAPKTINQRRYVEAIERHDLVFGVGPAGTGKTYLAVAMAVSALLHTKVSRIVLTRQGFNSKMVVTGDLTQIDLPSGRRSGLVDAVDVLRGVEGISFVYFDEKDVVRHSLVQKIVKAYERYNDMVGIGRQLALKLAPEPAAEPAADVRAEPEPAAGPETPSPQLPLA